MHYPLIAFAVCLSLVAQAAFFLHWLNMPGSGNRVLSPGTLRILGLAGAAGVLCFAAFDRDAVLFVGQVLLLPAFFTLRPHRAPSAQRDG
ncbi:MAG: hypothetical protein AB7E47_00420 [Desulfovibrionaceae bacterium]